MKLKIFTIIYAAICIIEICFGSYNFREGVYLTKPLIMIFIGIFYYSQVRNKIERQDILILIAFIFSWLGDIFLMFSGEIYFMLGLSSFLITHLFYIYIFCFKRSKANLLARIFIPLFSISMFFIIKNQIGNGLFIPVLIYMCAISIMAICASEREANTNSYNFVLIGSILFIISDSLIAINKFTYKLPASTLLVMSTYVLAQYLIAVGFGERNKSQ